MKTLKKSSIGFILLIAVLSCVGCTPTGISNTSSTNPEVVSQQSADQRIQALCSDDGYKNADDAGKRDLIAVLLQELEAGGQISNVQYDANHRMYSFTYADGTLGGIDLRAYDSMTN